MLHPVSDSVEAVERDGERSLRCRLCHYRYGGYEHDHKRSALMRERALDRHQPAQRRLCLEDFVLREFYCPGCAHGARRRRPAARRSDHGREAVTAAWRARATVARETAARAASRRLTTVSIRSPSR